MKKKLLSLLGISLFALTLGACNTKKGDEPGKQSESGEPVKQTFTVAFEVDGERYETLRVKDGEHPVPSKPNPSKEGFKFVGWLDGTELVDLETYVVTKNVTFTAKFEEETGDVLNVDDVKQDGKTYYLVMGWWETTAVDETTGEPKHTSNMTKADARMIYQNIIDYLKIAENATDEQIANISFRNYSSEKVADMGVAINADGDVDIMFGVGANITTGAGVETNDKVQLPTGSTKTARYVANLKSSNELGIATYAWIKDTNAGNKALVDTLTTEEIEESLVPETINLTVVVHGDTEETTLLQDKTTAVTMPTITVPEGKVFKGFALTADGEVVLEVAKNATLKYDDLKDLLTEGQTTIHLYPVFDNAPVVEEDLVVYVQVNGSNLTQPEAELFALRFKAAHASNNIKVNILNMKADNFKSAVVAAGDADVVIGGGNPVNSMGILEGTEAVDVNTTHFKNARRAIISDTCGATHKTLAAQLIHFLTNPATEYVLHVTFWRKGGDWVTDDEFAALKAGVQTQLGTYMGVDNAQLVSTYNLKLEFYDATNTKVADLVTETEGLREGLGTNLVIGCGADTKSLVLVEKKAISTSMVAAGRQVALTKENALARNIYEEYFVERAAVEE